MAPAVGNVHVTFMRDVVAASPYNVGPCPLRADMASAEEIYLFRHAVYREAAYHLQVPSARSGLHRAVIAIIERAWRGRLGDVCIELARHARAAQDGASAAELAGLQQLEVQYLVLGLVAPNRMDSAQAIVESARRVLELPEFWPAARLTAQAEFAGGLRNYGRLEDVTRAYEDLCRMAAEQGDLARYSDALMQRALFALHAGDDAAAEQYFDRAEKAAEELGSGSAVGWVMAARANLHDFRGDHATAERLMREAVPLVGQSRRGSLALAVRGNLANLLAQQGRRDEAIAEYLRLREEFAALDSHSGVATAHSNLGRQYLLEGRLEEAEPMIRQAMQFHVRAGIRTSHAFSATNLAEVCMLQGRFDEAQSLLDAALESARETGIHQRIAAVLATRAGLELMCGHEPQAQDLVEQARAEFEAARSSVYIPEYCDIVRLRIAAAMATTVLAQRGTSRLRAEPPQRRWLPVMRQIMAGMEAALAANRRPHGTLIEAAAMAGRALLAELEAAVAGNRPALVFRGWLAGELRPAQRKALIERMQKRSPSQAQALRQSHPALWAAMSA